MNIPKDLKTLADQLGTDINVTTTQVTTRERTPANAEKIAILVDLLHFAPEEDVDKYFLEMLAVAQATGINLKADPVSLLQSIERKHQAKPNTIKF